jgi:cytochrome P450
VNERLENLPERPVFNPLSPEFIRDPYPFYHWLRQTEPIHRTPLGFFVATKAADVGFVLSDRRFGKAYVERMVKIFGPERLEEPSYAAMAKWMLMQDPPDHTRLRGLVVKAFTARRVEEMRPRIEDIVNRLLDRLEPQGHMDLIADFAYRIPVTVICDMLGISQEDHDTFLANGRIGGRLLEPVPPTRDEIDEANAHFAMLADYFRRLFDLRRREPGDDLTSELVHAEEEGHKLSEEELTANIMLLFGAGHETTVNLIGNGLLALFRHPDQLQLLRKNPALIGSAIEEFLRYDSSVQIVARTAFEDIKVGSVDLAKGQSVVCLLGAANRDPEAFADPDRLDITRRQGRPFSFGGGIHHCLGAQLARIEGEIAIATLLRRLPNLRLDDPHNPQWRPTFALRGLKSLPASW